MKTLSFQQPWATLVASGIKDVENRTWDTKYRGKFLVHASSKKVTKDFEYSLPFEWGNEIINQQIWGNIAPLHELPTSAIIGYVELEDIVENSNSIWAAPEQKHWIVKNAFLFDEPIMNVKGKLNLFDYPLDEDGLPPAHKLQLRHPKLEGKTLTILASDEDCEDFTENKDINSLQFERSADLEILFDGNGTLKEVTKIVIEGQTKSFESDIEYVDYVTMFEKDGKTPIRVWSLKTGDEEVWKQICFGLKR